MGFLQIYTKWSLFLWGKTKLKLVSRLVALRAWTATFWVSFSAEKLSVTCAAKRVSRLVCFFRESVRVVNFLCP